jgi:ABC-type dipeptide/oligopeptide/nickel transport system permease subunit
MGRFPPWWWRVGADEARRLNERVPKQVVERLAAANGQTAEQIRQQIRWANSRELRAEWPIHQHRVKYLLGTDSLGRSLFIRCLTGGGISLSIGVAAAGLSVLIGTLYGAIAGYAGGLLDATMMRIVDILYGLPYILLVVLLAVAVDAWIDNTVTRRVEAAATSRAVYVQGGLAHIAELDRKAARDRLEDEALDRYGTGELSASQQNIVNVVVLLVAIGGVSWLTMARVVRGQVLALRGQPFMEAARAMGVGWFGAVPATSAAEPCRSHYRLRDADRAAGDSAGVVPEFPRDRGQAAAAELGKPGRGGPSRTQRVQIALVAAAVSLPAPGIDTAGAQLRGRNTEGAAGPETAAGAVG